MNSADTQLLYLAAFRYVLGRKPYMVSAIAGAIKEGRYLLTNNTKALMVREIEECQYLGDDYATETWRDLAGLLSKEKMRFKIGDVVSVRSDIDKFDYVGGLLILDPMKDDRGKAGRIIGAVDEGEYEFYKINSSEFWWPGAMLSEVEK